MKTKQLRRALLATAVVVAGFAPQAQANDWDWMVAPYVWMPTIGTDLERTVPPQGGASSDTSFDDVVDKLDGVFLLHAEGQGDDFGILTDFIFLGLADDREFERFDIATDLDARVFEFAGVWSPGEERYQGWEVFAGLRYIDVDLSAVFDPVNPAFASSNFDEGKNFYDFMLGARYSGQFSERWGFSLRGDGSTGDTEGTWNFSGLVSYKTNSGAWYGGYRYFSVEFGEDEHTVNLSLSGPIIGYGFRF